MKYLVANWKMKLNKAQTNEWVSDWNASVKQVEQLKNIKAVVAPSSLHFHLLEDIQNATIGAQDVSVNEKGSHTGDTGAFQLKEYVKYCIVGHSERAESPEIVKEKINKCLENDIIPIACFVDHKLAAQYEAAGVILAWEDPDNIASDGIYVPKDPEDIKAGINEIRNSINEATVLLYGGSVNKDNINDLMRINGVDGALIGTASLDPTHFFNICEIVEGL